MRKASVAFLKLNCTIGYFAFIIYDFVLKVLLTFTYSVYVGLLEVSVH